jgi:hypothetical protein
MYRCKESTGNLFMFQELFVNFYVMERFVYICFSPCSDEYYLSHIF